MRSFRMSVLACILLLIPLIAASAGSPGVVYSEDFSGGPSLAALGFTGSSPSYWALDTTKQCMKSIAPGHPHRPARIFTPAFTAPRANGPVLVEWKAWVLPAGEDHSHPQGREDRLLVSLADGNGSILYTLSYTPDYRHGKCDGSGFELTKTVGGRPIRLKEAATGRTPRSGTLAGFRLELNPPGAAGGDGRIRFLFDAGDGLGFKEYISVRDETHLSFAKLLLMHETHPGQKGRQIAVDDIVVRACVSQDSIPPV